MDSTPTHRNEQQQHYFKPVSLTINIAILVTISTILLTTSTTTTVAVTVSAESYKHKTPYTYSYATILEAPVAATLTRCASACQRNPSCDGFYYSLYYPICYLGYNFLKRRTHFVDPAAYRMYLRSSYVLPTTCPYSLGFQMVVTPDYKTFCLLAHPDKTDYFTAHSKCQELGASLLYLAGDMVGNLDNLESILNQLNTNWNNGWGGAHQLAVGTTEWAWSYGEADMTSAEYYSTAWYSFGSSWERKCMKIDAFNTNSLGQVPCSEDDQFVCQVVLF